MNRLLAALSIFLTLSGSALAADLPVALPAKAPAFAVYPVGNGWFYGVSASGFGGTAAASNAQGGTVMGGRFGIDGGYTGTFGSTFYFIEASMSAQAVNGASAQLPITAAVNFEERFAVGVPYDTWNKVLAMVPGLSSVSMPTVPSLGGYTTGANSPYVFAALYQDDVSASVGTQAGRAWLVSYGAGVGNLNRLTNGMVLDTSIEWKHQAGGMLVGSSLVYPFQDAYLATARLKF
jgi:hypothetical protein